jgi:DNA invertase Pin-like site-specific DNA recombinase
MKNFLAVARVSSREQEREGFSLDVQVDGLEGYAISKRGKIERLWVISESATKSDQRKIFREILAYAKRHHRRIDGILFYKVDRALRNMRDLVDLEELESKYGVDFISITQPTENTPSGRMMRRQLATFAAFTTEQQSLDVREGIAKRVDEGWFPSRSPFGYQNVRVNGRSIVRIHPQNAPKVQSIFQMYAYQALAVGEIIETLFSEGSVFTPSKPRFSESKLYSILNDRAYIGEVKFRGKWHPGRHDPLIDMETWSRVQVLLGEKVYRSHQMLYAGGLITCGHCGLPISGEVKEKQTKNGTKEYIYYRCSRYTAKGHPRIRVREEVLECQVLRMFEEMEANSDSVRSWFIKVCEHRTRDAHRLAGEKIRESKRQLSRLASQQNELLDMRLALGVSDEQFEMKQDELRQREILMKKQIESCIATRKQAVNFAAKAGDVFKVILEKWPTADFHTKRRILEIIFVKFTLNEKTLVTGNRTPFELLLAG